MLGAPVGALAHKMPILAHKRHAFAQRWWILVYKPPKVAHSPQLFAHKVVSEPHFPSFSLDFHLSRSADRIFRSIFS